MLRGVARRVSSRGGVPEDPEEGGWLLSGIVPGSSVEDGEAEERGRSRVLVRDEDMIPLQKSFLRSDLL